MEKKLISKSAQQIADYHQLYKLELRSLANLPKMNADIKALIELRNSVNFVKPVLNAPEITTLSPMIRSINKENMFLKQQQWKKSLRPIDTLVREALEIRQQFHREKKNLDTIKKIFATPPDKLAAQLGITTPPDKLAAQLGITTPSDKLAAQLRAVINASTSFQKSLHLNLDNSVKSYKRLFDANALRPPNPPLEIFRETEFIEAIAVPENEEYEKEFPAEYETPRVSKEIEVLLQEIDTRLPNLLQGAYKALNLDNHDCARHVTISLRELIRIVIHHLAPEDSIRSWTDESHYYDKGRPTRQARLLYITREIYSDPLSKFVNADVASALALIKVLNAPVHDISSSLTDRQLWALIDRTESLLLFLLRLNNRQ